VWTYFISVECFIGICEYVRHAARKKIANVWLRKVGIKGGARRTTRDYEGDIASFSEEEDIDDELEDGEEELDDEDLEYDYYDAAQSLPKRRRIEDDEEYRCEEDDEDTEERAYFQEMEEEEACVGSDTDDSADYESSSSSSSFRRSASLTVSTNGICYDSAQMGTPQFRIITSSEELRNSSDTSSSPASSPPSTPTSPTPERAFPIITTTPVSPTARAQPIIKPQVPECEIVPSNAVELCKEQVDWSYLHLRPNPHPLGSQYDVPAKYFASLMFGPQYMAYPQLQPYTYVIAPGTFFANNIHFQNMVVDPSGYPLRTSRQDMDNLHCELPNMDERQFDTNMFLNFPEEHHYQYPFTHNS